MKITKNMNAADIAAAELELANQTKLLADLKIAKANEVNDKLAAAMDSFVDNLGTIRGEKLSFADALNLLKQRANGTFGKLVATVVDRSRLTDGQITAVRAALVARHAALAANQPAEAITIIAKRVGTTYQTVNNWSKKMEKEAAATPVAVSA